ncbi:hypothetical protein [Effusibacillus lacus]|uniref:hypothetical protein n=1 Tax=Effusibacillus lacus TaxID=1348429 RepID=UPI000BB7285E|nr:hypothetical protein [Effusibacillus lacus]TCS75743.1 hypothetical protein EDD64_106121 [Effusibacillus lacus]
MTFEWNFDSKLRLEKILINLKNTGPKHLREIADELGFKLSKDSDRSRLKYQMKILKDRNEEIRYVGYTKNGYINPDTEEEFNELARPMKRRGLGFLRRAEEIEKAGKQIGKKRKRTSEQMALFIDDTGTDN